MSAVFLHIGMPKAGSSAIQDFCASNREALAENGICFPDLGTWGKGIGSKRNARWASLYEREEGNFQEILLRVCGLAEQYPKIILSDEGLWNKSIRYGRFWKPLVDCFAEHGIELRVVVYLRRQDEYVFSKWAQIIKASAAHGEGKDYTFQEYMDQQLYRKHTVEYLWNLSKIERYVEREHIIVRVYEPDQFEGFADGEKTIFSDFLKAIGETSSAGYHFPKELSNISLSGSVLETRRLLNEFEPFMYNTYNVRGHFQKVQTDMMRENCLIDRSGFTHAQRVAFMQQFEEGNKRIAKVYLGRKGGLLFYRPIGGPQDEETAYTMSEITEVCGRLMISMMDKGAGYRDRLRQMKERNKNLRDRNRELEKQVEALKKELREPAIRRAIRRRVRRGSTS